jgi:hypothetical protein
MTAEDLLLFDNRKAGFNQFYEDLIPALVDFVTQHRRCLSTLFYSRRICSIISGGSLYL